MIPLQYTWLTNEKAPKILVEAMSHYGTMETPGHADNPIILQWAKELGIKAYRHDEIAWCGLFMAHVVHACGYAPPKAPLWALNWEGFGDEQQVAMLGDILTFVRPSGGHVGIYVGEDADAYHVLGGNQSDMVCIKRVAKARLHSISRCHWAIGQPANVRKIILQPAGSMSTNEA